MAPISCHASQLVSQPHSSPGAPPSATSPTGQPPAVHTVGSPNGCSVCTRQAVQHHSRAPPPSAAAASARPRHSHVWQPVQQRQPRCSGLARSAARPAAERR